MSNRWRTIIAIVAALMLSGALYSMLWPEHYLYLNTSNDRSDAAAVQLSIRSAQMRTGIQFAVIEHVNTPNGQDIKNAAAALFRQYQLGHETGDRAILLYYTEQPSELKIEVSQRLEGVFPDLVIAQLEMAARTAMLKGRRADFLSELMITLCMHYEKADGASEVALPKASLPKLSLLYNAGGGAVGRGYAATAEQLQKEITPLPKNEQSVYKPAIDPGVVVDSYLRSLAAGIGDPALPFLSEGSRLYRLEWPQNTGQLKRNAKYYQAARPYRLIVDRNVAYALFASNNPVLPVVLKKENNNLWYIDEGRALAMFQRFEDSRQVFLKYTTRKLHSLPLLHPFAPSAPEPVLGSSMTMLADLEKRVQQGDSHAILDLAETLYFDLYWLDAALPLYERAILGHKANWPYRWRLLDGYLMTSQIPEYLATWDKLACSYPNDLDIGMQREFYHVAYDFDDRHWSRTMKSLRTGYGSLRSIVPALWYQHVVCRFLD